MANDYPPGNAGDDDDLDDEELAYLRTELARLRQVYRDLLVQRLMVINDVIRENRERIEAEVAAGEITDSILHVYDALEDAVVETGAFITTFVDSDVAGLSKDDVMAFLEQRGAATLDYNQYEGYRILANSFRH